MMPLKHGKTVLLVDDICTEGNSFEAGRAFIGAVGAETICLSWLKTINSDYRAVSPPLKISKPFLPQILQHPITTTTQWYSNSISSHAAPTDLADVYQRYFKWVWPVGL
jgi:hypoxanthine phosphoribosyltransferase